MCKLGDLGCAMKLSIEDELDVLNRPEQISMNDSVVM